MIILWRFSEQTSFQLQMCDISYHLSSSRGRHVSTLDSWLLAPSTSFQAELFIKTFINKNHIISHLLISIKPYFNILIYNMFDQIGQVTNIWNWNCPIYLCLTIRMCLTGYAWHGQCVKVSIRRTAYLYSVEPFLEQMWLQMAIGAVVWHVLISTKDTYTSMHEKVWELNRVWL